jgi:hypothetical protein
LNLPDARVTPTVTTNQLGSRFGPNGVNDTPRGGLHAGLAIATQGPKQPGSSKHLVKNRPGEPSTAISGDISATSCTVSPCDAMSIVFGSFVQILCTSGRFDAGIATRDEARSQSSRSLKPRN